MSSTKGLINTLMLAIATLAITACVPKATEKKAVCGTNQAFSTVSRSCYSIEELRTKPIGTVSNVSMTEETAEPITLTYTDGNKDKAISCKVIPTSTSLELIAPSVADGGIFVKANDVYQAANIVAIQLSITNVALTAQLSVLKLAMKDALDKAKTSKYYPTVISQLGIFKVKAAAIFTLSIGSTDGSVQYYYPLGIQRMAVLDSLVTNMTNRCECSGGVCTTIAIPKLNKSGIAGFSYSITDVDGEGGAKAAAVTIAALSSAVSHVAPVAKSAFYDLNESSTGDGIPSNTTYDITIPDANDLSGANPAMKYYFNGTKSGGYGVTTRGLLSGCMDLTGTSGATDKTCIYTPNNGNYFDASIVTAVKAALPIDDLVFTAVAEGTAANNFTVQYFNIHSINLPSLAGDQYVNSTQMYGLVNGEEEAFVRVSGNAIKIFINPDVTTTSDVQTLVNAHNQASLMVKVTGATGITPTITSTPQSLAGGTDSTLDNIPYYVNNLIANSTNTAYLTIRMNSVDDIPVMKIPASTTQVIVEDPAPSPVKVELKHTFDDFDTVASSPGPGYYNICEIDNTDAIFLTNFTVVSCTCVLADCSAMITPHTDVSSDTPFSFRYRIGSVSSSGTKFTAFRNFYLSMTRVNDPPEISTIDLSVGVTLIGAQTMNEGATKSIDVWVGPGGSGFETDQTGDVTLTVTSNDQTLLPDANIVVTDILPLSLSKKRITFTPAADQSGSTTLNVVLSDGITTIPPPGDSFALTVTPVNNPPVFISSIIAIQTNEGGAVQSDPFQIDEDSGSSADENYQSITIDSIESDNQNVLPDSAIEFFYDMNENGVEDLGEARTIGSVLEGVGNESFDVKLRNLYLKLDPVDGISGNANITMKISDHIVGTDPMAGIATYLPLTQPKEISFSFIVHPIAALHGGWNNISSVGIKTDKNSVPVTSAEIQCNYNLIADANNCGSAKPCVGDVSPNSTVVPSAANVIYWDKTSLRCYRSTSNNAFSWVDMNTSCPITRKPTACSGNNCISPATPVGSVVPEIIGQFQLAASTNKCYVSTGTATFSDWVEYVPAKVTLSWKPFIIVGSGPYGSVQVDGWNVYRRDAQSDYNFKDGHLQKSGTTSVYTITDPSVRTFTDTTAIAGRVYYYVVRPVDSKRHYPTYTPESFSEVRVIAAPKNYSFVHRWIVNQEMCNGMGITTTTTPYHVDQTSNFRCEYSGPGSVDIGGTDYYDIGKDLLVDSQESGCAYAAAPKCSPGTNGCIGIGNPDGVYTAALNDLYYDRSKGVCYVNTDGADEWKTLEVEPIIGSVADKTTFALNAPITNISRVTAHNICDVRTKPDISFILNGAVTTDTLNSNVQLPNKKDYMAYSSQRIDLTDPEITTMEQGFALNIQSRCNGSSASGLETAYTDGAIPTTSFLFSLPGTFSSGIRSLYTGSVPVGINKGTEACVSRFGIQDLYGNVAEWVDDGMTCDQVASNSKVCTVDQLVGSSFTSADFGTANPYSFNNTIGPFNEGGDSIVTYPNFTLTVGMDAIQTTLTLGAANVVYYPTSGIVYIGTEEIAYTGRNGTQLTGLTRGYNSTTAAVHAIGDVVALTVLNDDSYLTNWTFGDQFFGATNFNYPLGLPLSSNINQASFSAYLDWVLAIGPSNGITTNQLHEDGIIVNPASATAASSIEAKSFAVGGSYLSGNRAGRFSSELISNSVTNRPDVGFRCIVPINPADTANLGDYPIDDKYTYPP